MSGLTPFTFLSIMIVLSGFRRLHSFTLATIVQLDTLRFCRRFLTFDHREAETKFKGTRPA